MEETVLKEFIRDIPDFPKKGIIFKDITPLLNNKQAFQRTINILAEKYVNAKVDKIVAIESRGFIFGSALAYKLGAGLVPVRKKGKLPAKTTAVTYQLEYGSDTLEVHEDAIQPGENVLIVDDLLATGGTVEATAQLVEKLKGNIAGIAFVIELSFLNGRQKLGSRDVFSILTF